jgi:hypothetical protein
MGVRKSAYVSGTVITHEAAADHSDVGVGLCLQLPKAFCPSEVVDMSFDQNISVHFVFPCPSNTSYFEALHGYITLVSHLGSTVARRNTYACQIEPNARHCQFPGPSLTKPLILCFPKQRVNVVTRLVSCQISPASIASTVDDPIGVTELLTN